MASALLLKPPSTHRGTEPVTCLPLSPSPCLFHQVTSEWRVHSSLEHPHIVPLYGAVEDKHYVTLLMEAQEGDLLTHLDEQVRQRPALPRSFFIRGKFTGTTCRPPAAARSDHYLA